MAPIRCRGAEEDELLESVYVLVAVGAIVAGFVQGLSGFAFGMVAMSFWVWVLDPRLAAALAVFGSLTGQIVAAASLRRKLNAPLLLPRIERGGRVADGLVGVVGGAMGGIGGFTGTVPTLWCTLRGFEKDTQRAVIQNFNLSMLAVTMATYLATGVVERDMLPYFAIVGPAMLIPAFIGTRLYVGMSEAAFRTIVLGLLTVSGCALLISALPRLMARMG